MVSRKETVVVAVVFCMLVIPFALFAQSNESVTEMAVPEAPIVNAVEQAPEKVDVPVIENKIEEPEAKATEWLWGEVVSVDTDKKEVAIKHLDYETYEEIKTILKIDEKTVFENVSDISTIKAGDHITVDYRIKDGTNIVDLMVVEKEGTYIPSSDDVVEAEVSKVEVETPEVEAKQEKIAVISDNKTQVLTEAVEPPVVPAVESIVEQPAVVPAVEGESAVAGNEVK